MHWRGKNQETFTMGDKDQMIGHDRHGRILITFRVFRAGIIGAMMMLRSGAMYWSCLTPGYTSFARGYKDLIPTGCIGRLGL